MAVLLAAGCAGDPPAPPSYRDAVLQHRVERDMQMRTKSSVLTKAARAEFKGLRYFDVDSTYRFAAAPFEPAAAPDTVWMTESDGGMAAHVRVGVVTLPFPEGTARLSVFRPSGAGPDELWIPFADATNGQSTYGGGRYVDAAPRADGAALRVDFNKAYNPSCDYNPDYACPLPPRQNRLPFGVPAGEQKSLLAAK